LTAPPYRGEGPPALWHVSEDPTLGHFVPRDGKVWAVDTRHLPLYWFPRDCPRATFWANDETSDDDVRTWLRGERTRRVHVIDRMHTTQLYLYRMPENRFDPEDRFFVSPVTIDALERVELGDLVQLHADAGIDLRLEPDLLTFWDRVIATTLDYSGIRLRNAVPA
jgi:hypothetical protein